MARILVVDDSPTSMMLSVMVLESAGHTALQATRAEEAIEIAHREHPDVILMDIQLPDMDGLEATHLLKSAPDTQDIPIIALTAFAMKGDDERMLGVGCDGYIAKPISYRALLEKVKLAAGGEDKSD